MTEQPKFMQGIPKEGTWTLVGEYDKRRGQIDYREQEAGRTIRVPNIWYNQPVAIRVAAMEFYVARDKEAIAKHAPGSFLFKQLTRNIAALETKAIEMTTTGRVLA